MTELLGWLLGVEGMSSWGELRLHFGASWASQRPVLVAVLMAGAFAGGLWYYRRFHDLRSGVAAGVLGSLRGLLLALLVLIFAQPSLSLAVEQRQRATIALLLDGSQSMDVEDPLSASQLAVLEERLGPLPTELAGRQALSRSELVRWALGARGGELLGGLGPTMDVRVFATGVRGAVHELTAGAMPADERMRGAWLSEVLGGWKRDGEITALGTALAQVGASTRSGRLAGVVLVSDFGQNSGPAPLATAGGLGAAIHCIGVGPPEAADLRLELLALPRLKKQERAGVEVLLDQTALTGRSVRVRLYELAEGESETGSSAPVAEQTVRLERPRMTVSLGYTPPRVGNVRLVAVADPVGEEQNVENNRSVADVQIRDEAIRILFIENEPSWEWRFIKEVFSRDPLVGRSGFRTYLHSADARVKQRLEEYLPTVLRPRAELFEYDAIFVSDVPATLLPDELCAMLRSYVRDFGGGLVLLAGPEYGPAEWARTGLADLLPVVPDPINPRREGAFRLRFTGLARQYEFLQLGADEAENSRAWANMGEVPWYPAVIKAHEQSAVLATHPTAVGADGRTPVPLIAVRRVGKGEVVYIGTNQMWRLRRLYGELYYRQFWGQLLYRLALSRALDESKRFRILLDQATYRVGEPVRISVEAYDREFEPLEDVAWLDGELVGRGTSSRASAGVKIPLRLARSEQRVFYEANLSGLDAGEYTVRVRDPISGEDRTADLSVLDTSVERRTALRDKALQDALAGATGGLSLELHELAVLQERLGGSMATIQTHRTLSLWNTWLVLLSVLVLMLSEWLARKLWSLR